MFSLNTHLPINLLNLRPCISTLRLKPSAIASAFILVAPLVQFKKHVCLGTVVFVLAAL